MSTGPNIEQSSANIGRVCSQHKDSYEVEIAGTTETASERMLAKITGRLRHSAQQASDLPVVGDWVEVESPNEGRLLITAVLPRHSLLQRKVAGQRCEEQPIAANVDCAFLVESDPLNLNRLERYIQLCAAARVACVLLLSKVDLLNEEQRQAQLELCRRRFPTLSYLQISIHSAQGLEELRKKLEPKQCYCLLGSSGVGKSSLLNALLGEEYMATAGLAQFRQGKEKGRHTTTERRLLSLNDSISFIDNPGMRELGLVDFDDPQMGHQVEQEAGFCKFPDCSHGAEPDCAVREAVAQGRITEAMLQNYFKMKREVTHYQASKQEKHQKNREQGKLYRKIQSHKRKQKGSRAALKIRF